MASAFKLLGNFFIASTIEVVGEGMALADANGIPRATLLSFFELLFPGPIMKVILSCKPRFLCNQTCFACSLCSVDGLRFWGIWH